MITLTVHSLPSNIKFTLVRSPISQTLPLFFQDISYSQLPYS